ncbi:unnamed protein product [Sphacelaria rigidula]
MTSIKLVMAVAVQRGWSLYHFDVNQAFVRAKMDTNVFMKLPEGCSPLTGSTVTLEKSIYGIKQAGRQWFLLLNKTRMEDVGMPQSKADPCVYKLEEGGEVCAILAVHVDDILIGIEAKRVERVCIILNNRFPTNNLGEVQWYMGCAIERNWTGVTIYVNQTTFVDTMLKGFEVTEFPDIPASVFADVGPVTQGDKVLDRPYRSAVGGLMWWAMLTRPDIANAARDLARRSHDSCERHWRGVLKVLAYLNTTRNYGLTFSSGKSRLTVCCDVDYARKETGDRFPG